MEICDIVNSSTDGPKDAIKAIRKRLNQSAGKNYTVVMYTLTVLETCVKNCGKTFHSLVCSKEFISELVRNIFLLIMKNVNNMCVLFNCNLIIEIAQYFSLLYLISYYHITTLL